MGLQFDGTDDILYLPSQTAVTATPLTMACWVWGGTWIDLNPAAAQTAGWIMGVADASANNQYFALIQNNKNSKTEIFFRVRAGAISDAGASNQFPNRWIHACGVSRSATDREVYINGVTDGTSTTNRVPSGIDNVCLGGLKGSASALWYNCVIAEAGIWDVDLDDEEILALGNGATPLDVRKESLIWYLPLRGWRDSGSTSYPNSFDRTQAWTLEGSPTTTGNAATPHHGWIIPKRELITFGYVTPPVISTPTVAVVNAIAITPTTVIPVTSTPDVAVVNAVAATPTMLLQKTATVATVQAVANTALRHFVFEIDHETDDFSQYDSSVTDAGDLAVTAAAAIIGTRGLEVTVDDTTAIYGEKIIPWDTDALHIRFYVQLNAGTLTSALTFLVDYLDGVTRRVWCVWYDHSVTPNLQFKCSTDGADASQTYSLPVADNLRPLLCEIAVNRSSSDVASDGTFEVWIDGVSIGQSTGLDITSATSRPDTLRFGAAFASAALNNPIYLDDLKVRTDDTQIGGTVFKQATVATVQAVALTPTFTMAKTASVAVVNAVALTPSIAIVQPAVVAVVNVIGITPTTVLPVISTPTVATVDVVANEAIPVAKFLEITHEVGDLSEYNSTTGTVSAAAAAAFVSKYGLSVTVDDGLHYASKTSVAWGGRHLRFRMYIDPNGFTDASPSSEFRLLQLTSPSNLEILLRRNLGDTDYEMAVRVYQDVGSATTLHQVVPDSYMMVEFYLARATSSSASDGTLSWWVDGTSMTGLSSLDVWDVARSATFRPGKVTATTDCSGTIYIDELCFFQGNQHIGHSLRPLGSVVQVVANTPTSSLVKTPTVAVVNAIANTATPVTTGSVTSTPTVAVVNAVGLSPTVASSATATAAVVQAVGVTPSLALSKPATVAVVQAVANTVTLSVTKSAAVAVVNVVAATPAYTKAKTAAAAVVQAVANTPSLAMSASPAVAVVNAVALDPAVQVGLFASPAVAVANVVGLSPTVAVAAPAGVAVVNGVALTPGRLVSKTTAVAVVQAVGITPATQIGVFATPAVATVQAIAVTPSLAVSATATAAVVQSVAGTPTVAISASPVAAVVQAVALSPTTTVAKTAIATVAVVNAAGLDPGLAVTKTAVVSVVNAIALTPDTDLGGTATPSVAVVQAIANTPGVAIVQSAQTAVVAAIALTPTTVSGLSVSATVATVQCVGVTPTAAITKAATTAIVQASAATPGLAIASPATVAVVQVVANTATGVIGIQASPTVAVVNVVALTPTVDIAAAVATPDVAVVQVVGLSPVIAIQKTVTRAVVNTVAVAPTIRATISATTAVVLANAQTPGMSIARTATSAVVQAVAPTATVAMAKPVSVGVVNVVANTPTTFAGQFDQLISYWELIIRRRRSG